MTYLTIEQAAERLAMSPAALRKRLSREARRVGRDIRAEIGDGAQGWSGLTTDDARCGRGSAWMRLKRRGFGQSTYT